MPLHIFTWRNESICPYKDLYKNVHGGFVVIAQTRNNPNVYQQVNG